MPKSGNFGPCCPAAEPRESPSWERPHGSARSVPPPVAIWQKARKKDGQQSRRNLGSWNQRPDRNPQNPSGRSVPLAGVQFLRIRGAVGRSNEPKVRRRNQPASRKLQHEGPLLRKVRERLRRNRRRRLRPRQPGRPPRRKLLLSRLRAPLRPTFPWATEALMEWI